MLICPSEFWTKGRVSFARKMIGALCVSQEGMKRIHMLNNDSNAMVDRRIVVKLLVTYFERNQSPEILELMARMLGLSGRILKRIPCCRYLI